MIGAVALCSELVSADSFAPPETLKKVGVRYQVTPSALVRRNPGGSILMILPIEQTNPQQLTTKPTLAGGHQNYFDILGIFPMDTWTPDCTMTIEIGGNETPSSITTFLELDHDYSHRIYRQPLG